MIRLMRALEVLKAGQQVADPAAWKNAQVWTNFVAALFMLLQAFGLDFGFSLVHFEAIGLIIVFVVNMYFTIASSKKVGL